MIGNLVGTYNVFEASKRAGVEAVVFASSNHTIGGYETDGAPDIYALGDPRVYDHAAELRPDSLYGVSKAYGEALGRSYHDAFGLRVYNLRIGSVRADDDPRSDAVRQGSFWLDLAPAQKYDLMRATCWGGSRRTGRRSSPASQHPAWPRQGGTGQPAGWSPAPRVSGRGTMMSALWGLLYLDTECDAGEVLAAVHAACTEVVDGRAYGWTVRDERLVQVAYDEHVVVPAPGRAEVDRVAAAGHPCLVVYPRFEGLVTVGLLAWFSPEQVMDATPEGWAERAGRVAEERRRGSLADSVWVDDSRVEAISALARRLSGDLPADVAMVVFLRNPAVQVTSVRFARGGAWVDWYVRSDIEGRIETLRLAERAGEVFGGRFAFLGRSRPPVWDDENAVAFHAEDIALAPNPEWTTYDPALSRLYVPFWEASLHPVGMVVYDVDALLAPPAGPVAIRAVLPRPPAAVDPRATERDARLLCLATSNVPLDRAGLQFRDEASGEESIVFRMEVDWISARRIELDMGRVESLLWPGRELTQRVRIIDGQDARYVPLTPWSEPFLRRGKGRRL